MMKGFDSRTSEMQTQISAGVNFYTLLLKNATVFLFLPLSLSICFFFFFFFFLIAYYHFCGIKL